MFARTQKQVMIALAQEGTATWAKLLDAQDASLPEFHQAIAAQQAQGLLTVERSMVSITEAGRAAVASYLQSPPLQLNCDQCQTKGYWIDDHDTRLERLERLLTGRPGPNFDYDQGAITAADSLVRTAFMEERGDLHGSAILLIGDFDLMSIAMAMTGHPERIVVLDIDERVIAFVNETARSEGFPIKAYPFDVRHPIPEHLHKQFDLFLCDPVETLPGIRLYLSRGCQGLRGVGSAAYVCLTTLEASRRKWFDIQGILYEMGFALTDIRRKFSGYPDHDEAPQDTAYNYPILEQMGAENIGHRWYTSAFLRAEAVREPTVSITGSVQLGPELYVDDEAWATPR
jgi:predicted methyltransferase